MRFKNREHAAHLLVKRLRMSYANTNPLVLGIPRGAMPMARIIADLLGGELDVVLVHKLGHPDHPELAIGAIDESGVTLLADWATDVDPEYLEAEKSYQLLVLRKRRAQYTPLRAPVDPRDRVVIVVDDGTATGSTMSAALRAIRTKKPKKLIAAVAVASAQAADVLARECDALVCLAMPADFYAVGQFFDDFTQVSDRDVIETLRGSESKISAVG